MKQLSDEELDNMIKKEETNERRPNFKLADLLREKLRRLGYGVIDLPTGQSRVYKL